MKTQQEEQYTSTGNKFWEHPEAMSAYRKGLPYTIISTHISPEGSCNLRCSYCSVHERKRTERLPLGVIKDYILALRIEGLKAVILTGGGEPTLYPEFNELVKWLVEQMHLEVGLITNGTMTHIVDPGVWKLFTWIRVSLNTFPNWSSKISLPTRLVSPSCLVGASHIWAEDEPMSIFGEIKVVAQILGAKYVRFLPDCTLADKELKEAHVKLSTLLDQYGCPAFFHQYKLHRQPKAQVCHQSYFRPYLCETGKVYPCDSVVLNGSPGKFEEKFALCEAPQIAAYLNKRWTPTLNPSEDCPGCVFADTVDMLDDWKEGKIESPYELINTIHPNFV